MPRAQRVGLRVLTNLGQRNVGVEKLQCLQNWCAGRTSVHYDSQTFTASGPRTRRGFSSPASSYELKAGWLKDQSPSRFGTRLEIRHGCRCAVQTRFRSSGRPRIQDEEGSQGPCTLQEWKLYRNQRVQHFQTLDLAESVADRDIPGTRQ